METYLNVSKQALLAIENDALRRMDGHFAKLSYNANFLLAWHHVLIRSSTPVRTPNYTGKNSEVLRSKRHRHISDVHT